jgi:phage baseplate assembly protein V
MLAKARARLFDDTGSFQRVQLEVLKGEVRDDAVRLQEYGFSSHPFAGATALVAFLSGNRSHPVIVALDDAARRKKGLRQGEVIIYDDLGQEVHLTRDGIVIRAAGMPVTITNAEKVRMETPILEVTGEIRDLCDSGAGQTMSGMRSVFNEHTHPENNVGSTNPPNQPMAGS